MPMLFQGHRGQAKVSEFTHTKGCSSSTMAGQAAKKRLEENRKRLQVLRLVLLLGLACQAASVALAFRKGKATTKPITALILSSVVGWAAYFSVASVAAAVYDQKGELVDGGGDLNKGAIAGYSHDILYITVFVQVLAVFTSKAWYIYLVVPAYALYKLTTLVIIPYFKTLGSSPDDGEDDPAARKKVQRAEERAQRRRMKKF